MGHVRYSTAGDSSLVNAQPVFANTHRGRLAVAHNGNLVNAQQLRRRLERDGAIFQSSSDSEVFLHLLARSRAARFEDALLEALDAGRGAYSMVVMVDGRLFAARDPHGFRPLVLGRLGESWIVASETCAFDLIEAREVREVGPGEVVELWGEEPWVIRPASIVLPLCVRAHLVCPPDSRCSGRTYSGAAGARQLARKGRCRRRVVGVPDSGIPAALGYAHASGVPFALGMVRNHYVGRTFIEPRQSIRHFGVKIKLNAVRSVVAGRRVVLVDDSIVRGTTSRKIVTMLRHAGATEVHCGLPPPTIGPCLRDRRARELIARQSVEQIRASPAPTPATSRRTARRLPAQSGCYFCTACFSGRYPVLDPDGAAEVVDTVRSSAIILGP